MKVLFAVIGGVIGGAAALFLFANMGADWYTAQSEFQSPTEHGETHGTIYLAIIAASTVVGYIIGRIIGARVEQSSGDAN